MTSFFIPPIFQGNKKLWVRFLARGILCNSILTPNQNRKILSSLKFNKIMDNQTIILGLIFLLIVVYLIGWQNGLKSVRRYGMNYQNSGYGGRGRNSEYNQYGRSQYRNGYRRDPSMSMVLFLFIILVGLGIVLVNNFQEVKAPNTENQSPIKGSNKSKDLTFDEEKKELQKVYKSLKSNIKQKYSNFDTKTEKKKRPTYFSIQVGAFKSQDLAEKCADVFTQKGYEEISIHPYESDGLIRVRVGHFPNKDLGKLRESEMEAEFNNQFTLIEMPI